MQFSRYLAISVLIGSSSVLMPPLAHAQRSQQLPELDVESRPYGEEIVGPYHQPRWSARGRFSADTDVLCLTALLFLLGS